MSPQGWHQQGAVLVMWQLGWCQPDATTLFPKHTQSTVTTLPCSAYTWGRIKVLGGISVLWAMEGLQVPGMGAVCWDKYCRNPGDQFLSNDIMACVFVAVSLLLKAGGFPKIQMWELLVFWDPALLGLLGADLVSWSAQLHCTWAAPSTFQHKKKKILPWEYLSVSKTKQVLPGQMIPFLPHCRMCSYAFFLLIYLQ